MGRIVRVGLAALLLCLGPLALATRMAYAAPAGEPAAYRLVGVAVPAHSGLVSVVPADGAVLPTGPTSIVLTFTEAIAPRFAQLALTRDGAVVPTEPVAVSGAVLSVRLTDPGPGSYRIAYRVVSADGHPISGESTFRVQGAAATTAPSASTGVAASSSGPSSSDASSAAAPTTARTTATGAATSQPSTGGAGDEGRSMLIVGSLLLVAAVAAGSWEYRRRNAR